MNSLLAAGAWTLDIIFFLILLGGILLGVRRGFIKGICKLAGTILAGVVSITFCVALQASLEYTFGTTSAINNAIGAPFGAWIMVALSFVFLFLLVKIGCALLGKYGSALIEDVAPLRIANMFLGGILGAFKAFILIFAILAAFRWIPNESFCNFVASSEIVGKIFSSQWFIDATQMNFTK